MLFISGKKHSVRKQQRIESLDFIRGLAILVMGQYHFMRIFINEDSLNEFLFILIKIPGRLAAPCFLLVSGIGAVMFYYTSLKKGQNQKEIRDKTIKRGTFLIIISTILNVFSYYSFNIGGIWEWNVFQLIGFALIITTLLVKLRVIGTIFFIILWQLLYVVVKTLRFEPLSILSSGIFPVLPWLNYFLLGMFVGYLIQFNLNHSVDNRIRTSLRIILFGTTIFLWSKFYSYPHILDSGQRSSFMSMLLIFTLISSLLVVFDFLLKYLRPIFIYCIKLGRVALSTYYFHMIYIYMVVVSCSFFNIEPKLNWGLVEWILLNTFFWIPLFCFIRLFWENKNYLYSMEWFMNKYIAPRTLLKNAN